MTIVLVNPLDEVSRPLGSAALRLDTLQDKTIGLLDISKPGGAWYLDRMEELLKEQFDVRKTIRVSKPTYTKRAPEDLLDRLADDCDAVVEALAD